MDRVREDVMSGFPSYSSGQGKQHFGQAPRTGKRKRGEGEAVKNQRKRRRKNVPEPSGHVLLMGNLVVFGSCLVLGVKSCLLHGNL